MYSTPTEAFESLYKEISQTGEDYATTKALFNVSFAIENPLSRV